MTSTSSTVPKRQLGAALRLLREAKGIERDAPARLLACSVAKIGRIETGDVAVKLAELRVLLDLYEVSSAQRADLEELATQARTRRKRTEYGRALPDWFRKYVNLEEVATEIRSYHTELVPGLCQTEEYALAVTTASPLAPREDINRLVAARAARQRRMFGDDPAHVWAVLSEGALHRRVGGHDVMRRQLVHLRELADRPNVTIQISPFAHGANPATGFSFLLLKLPDTDGLDIVYLEDLTSARYVDNDAEEQHSYTEVWTALSGSALSPTDSAELLDTLINQP